MAESTRLNIGKKNSCKSTNWERNKKYHKQNLNEGG